MTQEALQEFRVSTSQLQRRDGPVERTAGLARDAQRNQRVRRLGLLDVPPHRRRRATSTSSSSRRSWRASRARRRSSTKTSSAGRSAGRSNATGCSSLATTRRCAKRAKPRSVRNVPSRLDARRRADLSVRRGGGLSRRVGAGIQLVARGPSRLVRYDPGARSPPSTRLASGRAARRRSTSSSSRRRTIRDRDGSNLMAFRFAAPIENKFYTLISRVDYQAAADHRRSSPASACRTTPSTPRRSSGPAPAPRSAVQQPGARARLRRRAVDATLTNSFRYGLTKIDENIAGPDQGNYATFRFIDPLDGADADVYRPRQTPTHNFVNDLSWFKGSTRSRSARTSASRRMPKTRVPTRS